MINNCFNVINLHLTEKCNYNCKYCFAKFNNENELNFSDWKKIVDIIFQYFKKNNIIDGRINLAGGEPLIVNYLDDLIDYIFSLGIKISIITNGSLLTKPRIDNWINKVDILGVSIDSINDKTNIQIGRSSNSKTIDLRNLTQVLNYASINHIRIKVNTVISKFNLFENLGLLYNSVNFNRIKILQVRVNQNCNESARKFEISKEEFKDYCENLDLNEAYVIETNDDMDCSYVIIDPKGNLVTNKNNTQRKIGLVSNYNIEKLIKKAELNYPNFIKRYKGEKS